MHLFLGADRLLTPGAAFRLKNSHFWHRVRIGPVSGARRADEKRNLLADNGIDSLVMKNPR